MLQEDIKIFCLFVLMFFSGFLVLVIVVFQGCFFDYVFVDYYVDIVMNKYSILMMIQKGIILYQWINILKDERKEIGDVFV